MYIYTHMHVNTYIHIQVYIYIHMYIYIYVPQQRMRLWGLQSVQHRRGDWGFGSRVPDSVRDVCAPHCRNWMVSASQNHLSWGAARDRSSLFDGTCLFAHRARSKCARGVRTQQFLLPEHVSSRTERDASLPVACERSSLVA